MGCMCADGTAPASHVDACKLCAAVAIAPSAVVAIAPLALLPLLQLLPSLMPLLLVWSPTFKSANHSLEVVCVDRVHALICVGCHSQLIYLTMHSKYASVFLGGRPCCTSAPLYAWCTSGILSPPLLCIPKGVTSGNASGEAFAALCIQLNHTGTVPGSQASGVVCLAGLAVCHQHGPCSA